jgi:hypothetical protein
MSSSIKKRFKFRDTLVITGLLTTVYITFVMFYLTYDIVESPDFEKYYRYFQYYSGEISYTDLDQGHSYFFFIYIASLLVSTLMPDISMNEILNISIHFANSVIYLIGIIGIYKLLIVKKFKKNITFLLLIVTTFLPASIVLRITFKPEILVFSLICWVVLYIDKYSNYAKPRDALIAVILLSILMTTKISTTLMVLIFLGLIIIFDYRNLLNRKNTKFLLLLLILSAALFIENGQHNEKYLHQVTHNENYNNQAPIEFFTSVNYGDLKNNPDRYFHSDSFISITLFDTFNDFFYLYWNSEYSELNQDRKQFFKIISLKDNSPLKIRYSQDLDEYTLSGDFDERWRDARYIDETRMRFSFYTSILFYAMLIVCAIIFRQSRIFILSTLIGLIMVIFSTAGFFGTNNYDPLVGDSVKVYYYSFFVVISFVFVLSEIFNRINFGKVLFLGFINLMFLFFIGFPFSFSDETKRDLNYKNSNLPMCEINQPIMKNLYSFEYDELDCKKIFTEEEIFYPIRYLEKTDLTLSLYRIPVLNILTLFLLIIISFKHRLYLYRKQEITNG